MGGVAPKNLDLRLGVEHSSGRRSPIWRIYTRGDDAYASHRNSGGIEKISFHASGICRRAFVAEHPLPKGMEDRVTERWRRADVLPPGSDQGVALLTINFPTGQLSLQAENTTKPTIWLEAPPDGMGSWVQLLLTGDPPDQLESQLNLANSRLVVGHPLPNGTTFAVRTWVAEDDEADLVVEAAREGGDDIVCPGRHDPNVPRPVTFTMFRRPEELQVWELSGYRVRAGEGAKLYPNAPRITKRRIIDQGDLKKPKG
jgi:hypothetical protein